MLHSRCSTETGRKWPPKKIHSQAKRGSEGNNALLCDIRQGRLCTNNLKIYNIKHLTLMTDRWARRKVQLDLTFLHWRGANKSLFVLFPISVVGMRVFKYFVKQTFTWQCSFPIIRSDTGIAFENLSAFCQTLDSGGRQQIQMNSKFLFLEFTLWNGASLTLSSITATTYDSPSHTHAHAHTYIYLYLLAGELVLRRTKQWQKKWPVQYCCMFGNAHVQNTGLEGLYTPTQSPWTRWVQLLQWVYNVHICFCEEENHRSF